MQETSLAFHRLTYAAEPDGVMVGRPEIDSYVVLPQDGAELLRRLADGMPMPDAASWYESSFGEPIDIDDFVETLGELGFVRAPGEQIITTDKPAGRQGLARAMFSPAAWVGYALLVVATAYLAARMPALRPRPGNVFFVRYLIVVQFSLLVLQTPGLFLHEWFHVMAGRRRGLPARLGVGRRFIFAVFEVELNGLLGLPRRQRYLPFTAGMAGDVIFFCGLTLAAAALTHGPSWLWKLLLAIAYLTLIRLSWQLLFFLRTDPYYAITTALGCVNLADASSAYLRRVIGRRTASPAEEFSPRDQAMAPWFALLSVLGSLAVLTVLAVGAVPVAVEFVSRLTAALGHHAVNGPLFWDGAASLAILTIEFVVLPALAGSRWLKRRATNKEIPS
jgi:hypothetical protein